MDPKGHGVFPKPGAYDHALPVLVKIPAAVPGKRHELGTDGAYVPGKTQHAAVVVAGQDQVCAPVKIGSAVFGTVGEENVYRVRLRFSHKLFHCLVCKLWGGL